MHGRPFYGVEPDGMDGRRLRYRTLEQAAAHYLVEIRKVQPVGPYLLGGYCFGGRVAFEMAQQLLRQGERAAAIVLLTAPLTESSLDFADAEEAPVHTQPPPRTWGSRLRRLAFSPWQVLSWRFTLLWQQGIIPLTLALGMKIPPDLRRTYLAMNLKRMEDRYVPRPHPGTLTHVHGSRLTDYGPELGWNGLAEKFEHLVIGDGNYQTRREIFNEPLVERTAKELNALLDAAISEVDDVQPRTAAAKV
jgi:aspartate racemase